MIPQFLLLTVAAYLVGSVPTAYLVARWRRGIDLRKFGSGNIGASNVVASGSRWSSLIVIIFDLSKGAGPVLVARALKMEVYQQAVVGLAAVGGHSWTVFLRFNGGRGILTALGVVLALAPWLGVAMAALAFACLPFGQFALGTLAAVVLLPLLSWFASGLFQIQPSLSLTLGLAGVPLIAIIRRLTASRTEFSSQVSWGGLMINRLLFDRDIRDRRLWLGRRTAEVDPPGEMNQATTESTRASKL